MNLWAWVIAIKQDLRDNGAARLADVMEQLPGAALNDEPAIFEALASEGLAEARRHQLPWVEVYLRHWRLQGRLHFAGETDMDEVVSLLEFAHRENTRDCPQTVCAAQDLGFSVGAVDAQGYADERVAAAAEGLARIDPSWSCFRCLTIEQSTGLRDRGDPQGALQFLDAQVAHAIAVNGRFAGEVAEERAMVLARLDRGPDALKALAQWRVTDGIRQYGERNRNHADVLEAWLRLGTGEVDVAQGLLPPLSSLPTGIGLAVDWATVHLALCDRDAARNTAEVRARLAEHLAALSSRKSHRPATTLAVIVGELARRGHDRRRVEDAVHICDAHVPSLRAPLEAPVASLLEELRLALADAGPALERQ